MSFLFLKQEPLPRGPSRDFDPNVSGEGWSWGEGGRRRVKNPGLIESPAGCAGLKRAATPGPSRHHLDRRGEVLLEGRPGTSVESVKAGDLRAGQRLREGRPATRQEPERLELPTTRIASGPGGVRKGWGSGFGTWLGTG